MLYSTPGKGVDAVFYTRQGVLLLYSTPGKGVDAVFYTRQGC